MGQVTNPIGMHLALTTLWRYLFIGHTFLYKNFVLGAFTITEICKNFFRNYSIPESIMGKPRNDKSLEQKDRNIQSSLISNSFVLNNMIYGNTTVVKQQGLLINVDVLDANLLEKKINEVKDLKKIDSSYLTPKPWKRRLAQSLIEYSFQLKKKKPIENYINPRRKIRRIISKSFRWCFRIKNLIKKLKKDYAANKKHNFQPKEKFFFRPKFYVLKPKTLLEYYQLEDDNLENKEIKENELCVGGLKNIPKNKTLFTFLSFFLQKLTPILLTVNLGLKSFGIALLQHQNIHYVLMLFLGVKCKNLAPKNILTAKSKKKKMFRFRKKFKQKKKYLGNRLSKLKRYPLMFDKLFSKEKNSLHIAPNELPWIFLKSVICAFPISNNQPKKNKDFWSVLWKNTLSMLWCFIDNMPKTIWSRTMLSMILQTKSQSMAEIISARSNFFCERYLLYQISNAALFSAVICLYKSSNIRFLFTGKHTRNMSATMLANYIVTKLGQYFTVQEIVKPIIYDLKTSPFLGGFKLMVAGRVTRKERAAFMLKQFGNLPLNKFSAMIDFAAESRIMKFGMVGIKVLLNKIDNNSSYYQFGFNNVERDLITLWFITSMLKTKFGVFAPKEFRYLPQYGISYRYFHLNSPWKHGVPKGLPAVQELKKAYKMLYATGQTQLTKSEWIAKELEDQKTRFVAKYNVLLFSKEYSIVKHLIAVKDFDEDYCMVSHVCTGVSLIVKNPIQQGFVTEYLAETNFKGQNKPQFIYHEIRLMLKSDLNFVDQVTFDLESNGLLYRPNVKLVYDKMALKLNAKGREAYAHRYLNEKITATNVISFKMEDLNKNEKRYEAELKRKIALTVSDETLVLIVADKLASSPGFYDLVTIKLRRRLQQENINFRVWVDEFMGDKHKETKNNVLVYNKEKEIVSPPVSPTLTRKYILLQDVIEDVLGELYAASKTPEQYLDADIVPDEKPSSILESIATKGKQPILNEEQKNIINDD